MVWRDNFRDILFHDYCPFQVDWRNTMLLMVLRLLWSINCQKNSMFLCLSTWDWTLLMDYLLDLIFFADVVLNAFFFAFPRFEAQREIIVSDKVEIFERFVGSLRAPISFISIIPFDLIAISTGGILCLRSALCLTCLICTG